METAPNESGIVLKAEGNICLHALPICLDESFVNISDKTRLPYYFKTHQVASFSEDLNRLRNPEMSSQNFVTQDN